jgi:hypothetical protein
MELRPLGFGEIFDRAVTLYIKNFVPFAGIVMVLVVPLAITQYVLDLSSQPQFDAMLRVFQHPNAAANTRIPTIFDSPSSVVVLIVSLFIAYTIWPFALNAVAVGVARLYRGRPVEFLACYEAVLRRWLPMVAMMGLELVVLLAWYFVVILVVVGLAVAGTILAAAWLPLAFLSPFFVIVAAMVMFASLAPLFVALTFAMYAVVIEERSAGAAFALGFARVFNRGEFWRAVLFAIASGAVVGGASMVIGFLALLAMFAHLTFLEVIVESLARAAIAPFGVVLLAIYYFDVRIRHEAFDIETGLDRLAAGAQTPGVQTA